MSHGPTSPKSQPEVAKESSNVNAKLQESFSSGNSARSETKKWAGNAKSIATKLFFALFGLIVVFSIIPYLKEEATKASVEKSTSLAGTTRLPRVVAEDIVLPPGGTVVIQKKLRCHADNISNELMADVTRASEVRGVRFTSKHATPIAVRVWFFDEGGSCKDDFVKLSAERVFL